MKHVCPRCNYSTLVKGDFIKHLKREKSCKPINGDISLEDVKNKYLKPKQSNFVCTVCDKSFSSKNGWKSHSLSCDKTTNLSKQIIELKKQVEELQKNNQRLYNVQNNNNININCPYPLRPFGQEFLDYIKDDAYQDIFFQTGLDPEVFVSFLKILHFDPDFPENHNVRMKNCKLKLMDIFRGNRWESVSFASGCKEMISNVQKIVLEYYDNNKDKVIDWMTKEELDSILLLLRNLESQFKYIAMKAQTEIVGAMVTHKNTTPEEWCETAVQVPPP